MARYDREFLVPYLQDICALYFLEEKLNRKIYKYKETIQNYRHGKVAKKPEEPHLENSSIGCLGAFFIIMFAMGVIVILSGFFIDTSDILWTWPFLIVGTGVFGWLSYVFISGSRDAVKINQKRWDEYQESLKEYQLHSEQLEKEHVYEQSLIPGLRMKVAVLQFELKKVIKLREQAYDANIIPSYYRNKYVAVYLFDWFNSSGADDLDHALSMFVLEEIKDRLDEIIRNQAEIILNQQLFLANQQKDMEDRRKFEDDMRRKLDQLQTTEEENLRYNRMIESNTAVTAYFATADYLRR